MKLIGYINHLVTNILHNTFFCVQQKEETYTGLEQQDWNICGELSL